MDAILLAIADFWWVAPAAAAGGVGAIVGARNSRRSRARRLDVEASRVELKSAEREVREARSHARAAKAELAVAKAALTAGQTTQRQVDAARRAATAARERLKQATQILRGRRSQLTAARGALRTMPKSDDALPLARTMAAHDQVLVAWMSYETDVEKALAYPAMSDAQQPATAEFLLALDRARWLRPASGTETMDPTAYAAYRASVRQLAVAFEAAERAARRGGGQDDPSFPAKAARSLRDWTSPDTWEDVMTQARDAASTATDAVTGTYARVRAAAEAARRTFGGSAEDADGPGSTGGRPSDGRGPRGQGSSPDDPERPSAGSDR